MADLISRAAAIDALTDENIEMNFDSVYDGEIHRTKRAAIRIVANLPAVDAVQVVHGRWIDENPDDFLDPRMRCSICTGIECPLIKWRYCPNCGAKMDGE